MKIGNIIYENEIVNHNEVEFINYYKGLMNYNDIDKSLPTLYVGWSFMKSCNPDNDIILNANILNKRIVTNELYWEFSFVESKSSQIKGVENFIKNVPDYYFNPKYKYINLDPLFFQISDVEDLFNVLPKEFETTYNFKNKMIYILKDTNIWGINLEYYGFYQFSVNDILLKIKEKSVKYVLDENGEIFQEKNKYFLNYFNLKRYVVTILR